MMTHYVLLKCAPGTDLDAVEARVRKAYQELAQTLAFFKDPVVYRSCIVRDTNADIMMKVDLDSKDCLKPYLTHPIHVQMAKDLDDAVVSRTSFDHM